ncbi:hypothetical protein J7J58_04970 [candidate division WOR-3 bacterium]|nr:hypothetical protein [candidate division WOR-3 bacterium]
MINYEEKLNKLLDKISGSVLVSIVGTDGMGLAHVQKDDSIDIEKMDADVTSIILNSDKVAKSRDKGNLMEMFFTTGYSTYIIIPINELYFVYLIVEGENQNLGLARYELHKTVGEIEESLK